MAILGLATAGFMAMIWLLARCPLGRAIGLSINRFADASHTVPGGLD